MHPHRPCVRSCIASAAEASLDIFYRWLQEHDVSRNSALKLEHSIDAGLHVISKIDVKVGQLICEVPKSAILSHRTAPFSAICPIDSEEASSADMILHLAASILHELRQGEDSKWWGWLQILPREMDVLPTFWGDEEIGGKDGRDALELLQGTEAAKELSRKDAEGLSCSDLRELFAAVQPYFRSTPTHPAPPTFHDFAHAFTLVSTRGFVIDDYHVIALIPYCDMFNHSTLSSHTSLRTDRHVEHNRLTSAPDVLSTKADTVEMRVERPVSAGEQVLTCYEDDIGDAKLLVEWGFITGVPAGPGLTWSPRDIFASRPGSVGVFLETVQRGRITSALTGQETMVGPANWDSPGLLNVWPDGRVSVNLLAALHIRDSLDGHSGVGVDSIEDDIIHVVKIIDSRTSSPDEAASITREVCRLLDMRLTSIPESSQTSDQWVYLTSLAWRYVDHEANLVRKTLLIWRPLESA